MADDDARLRPESPDPPPPPPPRRPTTTAMNAIACADTNRDPHRPPTPECLPSGMPDEILDLIECCGSSEEAMAGLMGSGKGGGGSDQSPNRTAGDVGEEEVEVFDGGGSPSRDHVVSVRKTRRDMSEWKSGSGSGSSRELSPPPPPPPPPPFPSGSADNKSQSQSPPSPLVKRFRSTLDNLAPTFRHNDKSKSKLAGATLDLAATAEEEGDESLLDGNDGNGNGNGNGEDVTSTTANLATAEDTGGASAILQSLSSMEEEEKEKEKAVASLFPDDEEMANNDLKGRDKNKSSSKSTNNAAAAAAAVVGAAAVGAGAAGAASAGAKGQGGGTAEATGTTRTARAPSEDLSVMERLRSVLMDGEIAITTAVRESVSWISEDGSRNAAAAPMGDKQAGGKQAEDRQAEAEKGDEGEAASKTSQTDDTNTDRTPSPVPVSVSARSAAVMGVAGVGVAGGGGAAAKNLNDSRSAEVDESKHNFGDDEKKGQKKGLGGVAAATRGQVCFALLALLLIFGAAAATAAILLTGGRITRSSSADASSTDSLNGGGGGGEAEAAEAGADSQQNPAVNPVPAPGDGGAVSPQDGSTPATTPGDDGGGVFAPGPQPVPLPPPTAPEEIFVPDPPRDYGDASICRPATSAISSKAHLTPVDGSEVSRIAFGSCFKPNEQVSEDLWRDVRDEFRPDLWIWLGDNMYASGNDINAKREGYNEARDDFYYSEYGPLAEPKIPVTGTWDDNDFGGSNGGNNYACLASSQAEFVTHFNIPESDPRHPSQGEKQQWGVYSSNMFAKPNSGGGKNGIHVINLDGRSHRSPTLRQHGVCEGPESTMLGSAQWKWFEKEMLQRPSVVKVVSTGVQVLPPASRARPVNEYCAYDGQGGTFDAANLDVGEGPSWDATTYESWAEIPQDRTRLLRLAERSINAGMAKHIIFLSGEQHWGEIMAKRLPPANEGGESHIFYEVTASGIDQNWIEDIDNPARVRVRSADKFGNGPYHSECNFPFIIGGKEYNDCANIFGTGKPGCSTRTDDDNVHDGNWGNCLPSEEELVPRERSKFGRLNKCTDNYFHTCSARANYGGLIVDWDRGTIRLSVFTPHEREVVASSITFDL